MSERDSAASAAIVTVGAFILLVVFLVGVFFLLMLNGCAGGSPDAPPPTQQQVQAPEPQPAFHTMTTLHVAGTVATGGTFSGTVIYDPEQAPIAKDVRGLVGNEMLAVQAYRMTLNPNYVLLPTVILFDGTLANHTIEFCRGKCNFTLGDISTLTFTQPNYRLQLVFQPGWAGPVINASWLQWGETTPGHYEALMFVTTEMVT